MPNWHGYRIASLVWLAIVLTGTVIFVIVQIAN
jgi:hypothetical protein